MVGRVADAVVLSEDERRFLESQVRRHKAPRSLSDRCRMILLCAEGLPSKEVAAQLGMHGARRGRAAHARIHTPRHDLAFCRAGHCHGGGDRQMLQTPSRDRVPGLSQTDRPADARGARCAYRHG